MRFDTLRSADDSLWDTLVVLAIAHEHEDSPPERTLGASAPATTPVQSDAPNPTGPTWRPTGR